MVRQGCKAHGAGYGLKKAVPFVTSKEKSLFRFMVFAYFFGKLFDKHGIFFRVSEVRKGMSCVRENIKLGCFAGFFQFDAHLARDKKVLTAVYEHHGHLYFAYFVGDIL